MRFRGKERSVNNAVILGEYTLFQLFPNLFYGRREEQFLGLEDFLFPNRRLMSGRMASVLELGISLYVVCPKTNEKKPGLPAFSPNDVLFEGLPQIDQSLADTGNGRFCIFLSFND